MLMLSRKDIETLSRKILANYLRLTKHRVDRIDPIDFAAKMCGIRFEFSSLRTDGRLLGVTSYGEIEVNILQGDGTKHSIQLDGKTAIIDKALVESGNTGRLNFTMMHEVAHQLLGALFPSEYNPQTQPVICRYAEEQFRKPITNWVEWQTNVLTSCLLLPKELVKRELAAVGDKIRMLNSVFAPQEYEQFSSIAEHLGVSKTALAIRLKQLGLIEKDYFHDPYALINIYPEKGEII